MLMPNIDIFLKKKNKNHQYSWECYQNLPEDEKRKQRLAEYRINYSKMQKIKAGWISILNKYIKLLLKFLLGCTMWLHET